ncbi:MAG: hypothetical protein ABIF01_04585, partial [Candidatus Micrarchaeota archaeon]
MSKAEPFGPRTHERMPTGFNSPLLDFEYRGFDGSRQKRGPTSRTEPTARKEGIGALTESLKTAIRTLEESVPGGGKKPNSYDEAVVLDFKGLKVAWDDGTQREVAKNLKRAEPAETELVIRVAKLISEAEKELDTGVSSSIERLHEASGLAPGLPGPKPHIESALKALGKRIPDPLGAYKEMEHARN